MDMSININFKKKLCEFFLVLIAFCLLFLPSAAGIETLTYCDSQEISSEGWKGNHTLPLFDPNLGDLVVVKMTANLDALQNFSLENQLQEAQNLSAESDIGLFITAPNSSPISANASISISENLDAFDGQMDFSGPSGRTIEGKRATGSAEMQFENLDGFIASVQNETIDLPFSVSIGSSSAGNCVFGMTTLAKSELCVTYSYEPKAVAQ